MAQIFSHAGVDLANQSETSLHTLGTKACGPDNTEYLYVRANGAITQYHAVGIDENYEAASLTTAHLDDGFMVGAAQIAFTDNYYGWVAVNGSNINMLLAAGTAIDSALTSGTAAGVPDGVTSVGTRIHGLVNVAAPTTSVASAVEVIITNAHSASR